MAAENFDNYATGYDEELAKAISASGEGREYFAEGRVAWLARCLERLGVAPKTVLDFGCGDGFTTPMLLRELAATSAIGIDVSEKSLEVARDKFAAPGATFERLGAFRPTGTLALAYCNGVFHHIPPAERDGAVTLVRDALHAGGLFSLWENNPWNPATRYVMSQCAFDKDAQTLTPPETRRLLERNGFEILRTDFRFIFPRALRILRRLENLVYRMPLGTQYQVLARKRG